LKKAYVFLWLIFLACNPAGRKPEAPAYWQAQKARLVSF